MKNKTPFLDFAFCPALAEMLRTRRAMGTNGKVFDGLAALSTSNNLLTLRSLMLDLKPKRTLEIGLSFGGSCLVFTASHRELGHAPEGQHVALDPYQATIWDDCGLLLAEQAGLLQYLDFRPTFSSLELPALIREGLKFDLAYVDGSHLFEDVFVDFFFVSRLLSENGIVLLDDCTNPHIGKVLRFIRSNLSYAFAETDLTPYRAEGEKSIRYRMARLLGKTQMTAFRRIGSPARKWDAEFARF